MNRVRLAGCLGLVLALIGIFSTNGTLQTYVNAGRKGQTTLCGPTECQHSQATVERVGYSLDTSYRT